MMQQPETQFGRDPKPYILAFLLLALAELIRRVFFGFIPHDFTAYLHAADLFADGGNPFTDARSTAERYDGFPYNYLPGTLYLIYPLSWFSTPVALAIDWIARIACWIFSIRVLHRRVAPDVPIAFVILLVALYEPVGVDMISGNIVTYLFAAFMFCVDRSFGDKPEKPLDLFIIFICGLLIAFKPFWCIPIGFVFLVFRRWRSLVALIMGTLTVVLLTLPLYDMMDSWFAHTDVMRGYYRSIDFFSLAPYGLIPVWITALGAAAFHLRRGPYPNIWILACVTVPMWPRVAAYSYTITLPVVLYLCQRWGWVKGLLFSVTIVGPLAWILRDLPYLPNQEEELWAHFIWVMLAAVALIWTLAKERSETSH